MKHLDYGKLEAKVLASVSYDDLYKWFGGKEVALENAELIYAQRHKCKVVKIKSEKDTAVVKFLDPQLMPQEMEVPISTLTHEDGRQFANSEVACPKCGVPWKETMLVRFPVYDCPKCGAKKEDHV